MACKHLFLQSAACTLCGWPLPRPYEPLSRGPKLPPCAFASARCSRQAPHLSPPMPSCLEPHRGQPVIVPCISCDELAQHDADAPILECPTCHSQWACERWRTADELIAFIREKLAEDQDASRRAFYNAQSLLFQIAQAVDAFPVSGGR